MIEKFEHLANFAAAEGGHIKSIVVSESIFIQMAQEIYRFCKYNQAAKDGFEDAYKFGLFEINLSHGKVALIREGSEAERGALGGAHAESTRD